MVMSERSAVVGVFTEDLNANLAADELRRVGFSDEEISVSRHQDGENGFMAGLKRLFKGQETTSLATADDFVRMGVPEEDASYYQSQLDAGRTIVLVRVAGQDDQVLHILHKYAGITSRDTGTNTQTETNSQAVAPDMYDPVANRDADYSMMPPEDLR